MQGNLRPKNFNEFVGQEKLVHTLKIMIDAAKRQNKQVDHILFYGQPGIGKTSLSLLIANEMNSNIKFAVGSLIEKRADILALLGTIKSGDVLFIDEIHALPTKIGEVLIDAMDNGKIDIEVGSEGNSKTVRMMLPKFTIIGATTKFSKIDAPLRDRFGLIGKLLPLESNDLAKVLKTSANKLGMDADPQSLALIASNSRGVPRIANNLLKRANDFVIQNDLKSLDEKTVRNCFKTIGLYEKGLTDQHLDYLKHLSNVFNESWVSLETVSKSIGDNKDNLELETEPILLATGLIERSSRGRRITSEGINYILRNSVGNVWENQVEDDEERE